MGAARSDGEHSLQAAFPRSGRLLSVFRVEHLRNGTEQPGPCTDWRLVKTGGNQQSAREMRKLGLLTESG